MTISAIGVVIPARDEQELIGSCLDALTRAISEVDVPVLAVVVLDSCLDGSELVVARYPAISIAVTDVSSVGQARRLGTSIVLGELSEFSPASIWLANTDADSTVPADWLVGQLALAADGWDAVVGTVAVADWTPHHPSVSTRWEAEYVTSEHHPHVHGANLGIRASAYLEVGGWPPIPAHEDVELVRRLASRLVVSTATLPVVTSARRDPRCARGFGDTIRGMAG